MVRERKRCRELFRGAWRGAGVSGCSGLTRVYDATNERDNQPRAPNRLPLNRPLIVAHTFPLSATYIRRGLRPFCFTTLFRLLTGSVVFRNILPEAQPIFST